ncbi:unnamed protein product [Acanthoscelides obtectus]|uniref:Uncharacterized protein n=1 Tax=Acanthoscelides obtectus TaxID=200917 RepID=A0A9P0LGM0_ACAOB|nr:unnamed protein product [Acanthoscelides obtectus]CAK1624439.1 hypothetical protein AOBTE_LOCUS2572 [Acanthoscelides obtectus]
MIVVGPATWQSNHSISQMNQLLCCLRYYASAGLIRQTAYFMGMVASIACRIVGRISRNLASLFPSYVKIQLFNCNTGY